MVQIVYNITILNNKHILLNSQLLQHFGKGPLGFVMVQREEN